MNTRMNQNRRGVTLLFVISMIVLFLLMGTTFVIVSNDFLRSSRQQSRVTLKTIESTGEPRGERFMNEALYQLLRGPDLENENSPLRGHSILADMYGYGISSFVKGIEDSIREPASNGDHFIRLELIGPDVNLYDGSNTLDYNDFIAMPTPNADYVIGHDILSGNQIRNSDIGNAPGRFNGQLLTFVSGGAEGLTCRIIDHQVFVEAEISGTGTTTRHKFVAMPFNAPSEAQNSNLKDDELVVGLDDISEGLPTRVVINGRPFAGTGVGLFDPTEVGAGNNFALGQQAYSPNQKGKTRQELYTDGYLGRTSFGAITQNLPNPLSTNECYDAPDIQNMFLSGSDSMGIIPSFWRRNMPALHGGGGPNDSLEYSFRPQEFDDGSGGLSSASACISAANENNGDGFPFADQAYDSRPFDVDNDGDGELDGIWMDINLPTFSDEEGRLIKPLVSYQVVDLDRFLNINVHGNLSQIGTNQRFANGTATFLTGTANFMPQGAGFGPSEVYLTELLGDAAAKRLMLGDPNPDTSGSGNFMPGRYGGSQVTSDTALRSGQGPVPGEEYVDAMSLGQDPFSRYKLFGHPNYDADPDNLSVVGGFYQTPMDIYGRFRTGYPSDFFDTTLTFQTSMPVIDVFESTLNFSEVINNPYETDFSPPPTVLSTYDQLFTLEELEGVYRRDDREFRSQQNRIIELADLYGNMREPLGRLITTESWEVPTIVEEFILTQNDNDGDMNDDTMLQFENLMTKLYSVLATPSDPNFGVTESDPVLKHELIMRHVTGFFFDSILTNDQFRIDGQQRSLLSNDIRSGRPFNINRPFGNGQDDNSNNVVDEPGENDQLSHPDNNGLNDFDHDQDGFINGDSAFARQMFARQLYILTLLATELVDRNGNGSVIDDADFPDFTDDNGNTLMAIEARREFRKMPSLNGPSMWLIFVTPIPFMTPCRIRFESV